MVSLLLALQEMDFASWLSSLKGRIGIATALSAVGIWLMLPHCPRRLRVVGVFLAVLSLACYLPAFSSMADAPLRITFWIMAGLSLTSATAAITSQSPVYSAIWFAVTLLGTGGLLLLQGSQFLGVATVAVYAGAIVVTFLFVLMLSQPEGHAGYDRLSWGLVPTGFAVSAGAILVGGLAVSLQSLKTVDTSLIDSVRSVLPTFLLDSQFLKLEPDQIRNVELVGPGPSKRLRIDLSTTDQMVRDGIVSNQEEISQALLTGVPCIADSSVQVEIRFHDVLSPHHVAHMGSRLFSRHLVGVQVAGTLLLAALVGAVAMVSHGRGESLDLQT